MNNNIIAAILILTSIIVSTLAGCQSSPPKYIPRAIDSVANDKNNLGLNGKVKTMDIYYYRPEKASSLFSVKFKKGEKWEEDGIHHHRLLFDTDGNMIQHHEYNLQGDAIRKVNYTYDSLGHTREDNFPGSGETIVRKYNSNGQLTEIMYHYGKNGENDHGEINTYDDRGNLIRTEQTDGITFKPAMIEYGYNDRNLLVEERVYYSKGELSSKTIHEHDTSDLLIRTEIYNYLINKNIPEASFVYEYKDDNHLVEKYEIDADGNKELVSWREHRYYPDGKLKAIVRDSHLQESYDEQGRLINKNPTPGFEILRENSQDYDYDHYGNWTKTKNFKDYVDFGTGIGKFLKPYVERSFTYHEE